MEVEGCGSQIFQQEQRPADVQTNVRLPSASPLFRRVLKRRNWSGPLSTRNQLISRIKRRIIRTLDRQRGEWGGGGERGKKKMSIPQSEVC